MSIPEMAISANEKVDQFLARVKGDPFDICDVLYTMVFETEEESQAYVFKHIAETFSFINSNNEIPLKPSEYSIEKESLKQELGKLSDQLLLYYLQQNMDELEFYREYWKAIHNSYFLPKKSQQVFAFYNCLIDKRIPYYELNDGYSMANDKYRLLREKHSSEIKKLNYIKLAEFSQKTEQASLMLEQFDILMPQKSRGDIEVEEYEKKLVLMVELLQNERLSGLSGLLSALSD